MAEKIKRIIHDESISEVYPEFIEGQKPKVLSEIERFEAKNICFWDLEVKIRWNRLRTC